LRNAASPVPANLGQTKLPRLAPRIEGQL
jgi:hypothetical protein